MNTVKHRHMIRYWFFFLMNVSITCVGILKHLDIDTFIITLELTKYHIYVLVL